MQSGKPSTFPPSAPLQYRSAHATGDIQIAFFAFFPSLDRPLESDSAVRWKIGENRLESSRVALKVTSIEWPLCQYLSDTGRKLPLPECVSAQHASVRKQSRPQKINHSSHDPGVGAILFSFFCRNFKTKLLYSLSGWNRLRKR